MKEGWSSRGERDARMTSIVRTSGVRQVSHAASPSLPDASHILRIIRARRKSAKAAKNLVTAPWPMAAVSTAIGPINTGPKVYLHLRLPHILVGLPHVGLPFHALLLRWRGGSWVSKRRIKNWGYFKTARIRPVDDNYKSSPSILVRLTLYT